MTDNIELARRMDALIAIGIETNAKMDRLVAAFLAREPLPQLDDLIAVSNDTAARINAAIANFNRPTPR